MTSDPLALVIYPSENLKAMSADILEIDQSIVDFGQAMAALMYGLNGIGLAAPQVAHHIRLIAVDVLREEPFGETLLQLINPTIVDSHGKTTTNEGCLSFPGISADVRRKEQIHVKAYDLAGGELDFEADGLLSVCIQHEIDHLNGVTFVDRLNPVTRKLVIRDYLKQRRAAKAEEVAEGTRAASEG